MQKNNNIRDNVWSHLFEKSDLKNIDSETENVINRLYELSESRDFDEKKVWSTLQSRTTKTKKTKHLLTHPRIGRYAAAIALIAIVVSALLLNKTFRPEGNHNQWMIVADNNTRDIRLVHGDGKTMILPERNKIIIDENDSITIQYEKNAALSYKNMQEVEPLKGLSYNILDVPLTKNYRLELSDGSVVYLNSDTRIRFPNRFAKNERRVFLEKGEAYFEVSKNTETPFIVEVRNSQVSVLGTAFNISAYNEEAKTTTTLVQGKVKVHAQKKEILLYPGQQAVELNNNISLKQVDAYEYAAWRDGLFIFRKQPLESVMWQIYRWYGCSVLFTSNTLRDITLTGVIQKQQSLEEIFRILEKTAKIKVEMIDENKIRVLPRN